MSRWPFLLLVLAPVIASSPARGDQESRLSTGRMPDSTEKRVSEIRASETRKIPLEVAIQASREYHAKDPIQVTIVVTNLFDEPIVINRRMLVNHPLLKGEVSFQIEGPDGKAAELQRLVTPLAVHDDDFVVLPRGHSVQRTVDLSDLYGLSQKGVYKIKALYHNDLDQPLGDLRAWKGSVASETAEIVLN